MQYDILRAPAAGPCLLHFDGLGALAVALGLHVGDLGHFLVVFYTMWEGLGSQNVLNGNRTPAGALFCWKPVCQTGWPGVKVMVKVDGKMSVLRCTSSSQTGSKVPSTGKQIRSN